MKSGGAAPVAFRAVSVAIVATAVALLFTVAPAAAGTGQADPLVAPHATLSGDGRVASDGTRTVTVDRVWGIEAGGATVTVSGSGFDENKGIYVALCAIPAPNQVPTPCGGGVDQSGASGASGWISSDPPSYGKGLAVPYGAGGSFTVALNVAAAAGMLDCRAVPCAVVTRNDHTRNSDRSQDIFVPISFAEPVQPPPAGPAPTWPTETIPAAPGEPGTPTWPTSPDETAPVEDPGSTSTTEATAATNTSTTSSITTTTSEVDDQADGEETVGLAGASSGSGRADGSSAGSGGSSAGLIALVAMVAAAVGGGGFVLWRRRSPSTAAT